MADPRRLSVVPPDRRLSVSPDRRGSTTPRNVGASPMRSPRMSPRPSISGSGSGTFEDLCDEESEGVRVYVRVRPFNSAELAASGELNERLRSIVQCEGPRVALLNQKEGYAELEAMTFDDSFWSIPPEQQQTKKTTFATQEDVYNVCGDPVLRNAMDGYNSCIFAYGQTGSGKTHTMMGYGSDPGLIPRLCHKLFDTIQEEKVRYPNRTFEVTATFFEIYNEKVKDLLCKNVMEEYAGLKVRNHPIKGPYVEGLETKVVSTAQECLKWIEKGGQHRTTKQTGMNDTSSRSHAIFKIEFSQSENEFDEEGNLVPLYRAAAINLVDLAGSERIKKSKVEGDKLAEATHINQSLTTLRKVIDALIDIGKGKKAIAPYRESMLTWVLSESLGGNSRTVMIAAVSPHYNNAEETLSTLRYALRAKSIVNKVRANESKSSRKLREMKEQMAKLQEEVSSREARPNSEAMRLQMEGEIEKKQQEIREAATRQREQLAKQDEMRRQLEAAKKKETELIQQQLVVEKQNKAAEEQATQERQRNFTNAFRNAYQISISRQQFEKEVNQIKSRHAAFKKEYEQHEEEAVTARRAFDEAKSALSTVTKDLKHQEFVLSKVAEQANDFLKRADALEAELAGARQRLQLHTDESTTAIQRLEATVANATRERDSIVEALTAQQDELRALKQQQEAEVMSLQSRYDKKLRELSNQVLTLQDQETRMDTAIRDLGEAAGSYETQARQLITSVDTQERELEVARIDARHRKVQDQRDFRDIVQEMEIERETYKDMVQEGRALLDKIRVLEERLVTYQGSTLYRSGEAGVRAWLTSNALDHYSGVLERLHLTNLELLTAVQEPMLKQIGVLPGHRRKFLASAEELVESIHQDPSILDSARTLEETLLLLYRWHEEFSIAVNGYRALPSPPQRPARVEPTAVHTVSSSQSEKVSQKVSPPGARAALFRQEKGPDGLWRSPGQNAARFPGGLDKPLNPTVVEETIIRMIDFSPSGRPVPRA